MTPEVELIYRRFVGVGVNIDTREPLTQKQRQAMEVWLQHTGKSRLRKAAEALGMSPGGLYSRIETIRSKGYRI